MLHDLHIRGRTEIEALNGKIVELAGRFGLNATTNRMLTQLVRAGERAHRRSLETHTRETQSRKDQS
jgi:ketopantoate reductase